MPNKKNTELSDFLDTDEFYDIKQKLLDEGIVKNNADLEKIIEESEFDFELSDLSAQEGGSNGFRDNLLSFFESMFSNASKALGWEAEPEPQFDESVDCEDEPENPLCSSSELESEAEPFNIDTWSKNYNELNKDVPRWKNYEQASKELDNIINNNKEDIKDLIDNENNDGLKKKIETNDKDFFIKYTENANDEEQNNLLFNEIKNLINNDVKDQKEPEMSGGDLSDTSEFNEEFNISDNLTSETVQSKISSLLNEVFENESEN